MISNKASLLEIIYELLKPQVQGMSITLLDSNQLTIIIVFDAPQFLHVTRHKVSFLFWDNPIVGQTVVLSYVSSLDP